MLISDVAVTAVRPNRADSEKLAWFLYTPLPACPIVWSLAGKEIKPTSHPGAAAELLLHGLLNLLWR